MVLAARYHFSSEMKIELGIVKDACQTLLLIYDYLIEEKESSRFLKLKNK